MWFARFFGGRKVDADDEPARFAAPESAKPLQPVRRVQGEGSHSTVQSHDAAAKKPRGAGKAGFDPYNSGSFDRGNAWGRVIRR